MRQRRALKDDRMGRLLVGKGGVALSCHTAEPNSMISNQHVSGDEGNGVKRLLKTGPKGA